MAGGLRLRNAERVSEHNDTCVGQKETRDQKALPNKS